MNDTIRTVPDWDDYFLAIAVAVSARASCTRRQVGAVLVKDQRIIGTGYNGAASGQVDCLHGGCPRGAMSYDEIPGLGDYDRPGTPGFCVAIHAELNALLHSIRDSSGAIMFITDPPCPGCRKSMAAAGVARVVWPGGELSGEDLLRF